MLTAAQKHHVFAALREIGPSELHLARLLGVTTGVIGGIRRRHRSEWQAAVAAWKAAGSPSDERYGASPPPPPPLPEPPPRDPVEVEQERLARLKGLREERQALREVAGEKSLRTMLEALMRSVVPVFPLPPARSPLPIPREATQETLLLVLSDFHGFELVSPEATRGLNEYSGFIMCQRARRVVDSVLSIKQRMEQGGGWVFPKLVIALNGDMVSGTIHEVERHTDAKNIVTATYGVGLLVAAMVQDFAAAFNEVEVFCISGNHGRLPDARKMQSKDPLRNFDTLIALTAKEVTRRLSNVTWHIPNAYAVAYDVEGWTVLQQHGDNVPPGALSVPLYGIDRQVRNINALEAQRGGQIHYFIYSHFHNTSMTGHAGAEVIVNGSLIGGTEWTINRLGKCDPPRQMLVAFHPEHGMTHRWPLSATTDPDAPAYELLGLWELEPMTEPY